MAVRTRCFAKVFCYMQGDLNPVLLNRHSIVLRSRSYVLRASFPGYFWRWARASSFFVTRNSSSILMPFLTVEVKIK